MVKPNMSGLDLCLGLWSVLSWTFSEADNPRWIIPNPLVILKCISELQFVTVFLFCFVLAFCVVIFSSDFG